MKRRKARCGLERYERRLNEYFANGDEVEPAAIKPRLVEIGSDSEEELLFRYARLLWSIPVSAGYGRRLRYLIFDDHNDKLIGLFGLGDPVFSINPRDQWVGWGSDDRRHRLRHVMDAFILGAVPPYNDLLGGKLVALLMTSNEVRSAFRRKYTGREGLISEETFSGDLAMLTTASALGRSSVYNRLKYKEDHAFISVGFTAGSGEFHFANGVYEDILAFADHHCTPSSKHDAWGGGWRNRREVVRTVLGELDMSRDLVYHGIQRELFVVPLASNTRSFLRGDDESLVPFDRSVDDLFGWFRERWLLARAERIDRYRAFNRHSLLIWHEEA